MKIHCFNIEYDVSDEQLDFADDCKKAIVMPSELDLDIDDEDWKGFQDDIEGFIANEISEKTDWLVESFEYEVVG